MKLTKLKRVVAIHNKNYRVVVTVSGRKTEDIKQMWDTTKNVCGPLMRIHDFPQEAGVAIAVAIFTAALSDSLTTISIDTTMHSVTGPCGTCIVVGIYQIEAN